MKCFFEKFSQVVSILERENFDNFEKIDDICTAEGMPQNGGFLYTKLNFIEMGKFSDGMEIGMERGIEKGMKKGVEVGREKGLQEAKVESIRKMIEVLREIGFKDDQIIAKIKEKYEVLEEEIRKYM